MYEIHDRLDNPCPQCALKHLSAALAVHLQGTYRREGNLEARLAAGYAGVAYVNYVECVEGYASHLHYAIGALVLAEEHAVLAGADPMPLRAARLLMTAGTVEPRLVLDALANTDPDLEMAHLREAFRELPMLKEAAVDIALAFCGEPAPTLDSILDAIRWTDRNFFDDLAGSDGLAGAGPEGGKNPPPGSAETTGENEMAKATVKKVAAKAAPKKAPAKKAEVKKAPAKKAAAKKTAKK